MKLECKNIIIKIIHVLKLRSAINIFASVLNEI